MSICPSYIPYVWSIILDQSMHFFSKAVIFFPFDMVSDPSIVIYLTHKGGHFSPKSWNIFRMLPKHMCDRPSRIFGEKVPIFVEKLKKMKPPKMTFRSQIEPSVKSYECFMFFQNFRLEITLDWWILERQVRRLCHKAPKKHHTLPADVLPNASEALLTRITNNRFARSERDATSRPTNH